MSLNLSKIAHYVAQSHLRKTAVVVSPDHYLITESGEYVWSPDRVKAAWGRANSKLDYLLQSGKYDKLILMIGIPASGKSTWIQHHNDANAIYFDATFSFFLVTKESS